VRAVTYMGIVSDVDSIEFYKNIKKIIEENPQHEYEFQYNSVMQLNGKVLFTCFVVGRQSK
jgi:hypothetical protein